MGSNDSEKRKLSPEDEAFLALHPETPAEQEARAEHIKKILEKLEEERRAWHQRNEQRANLPHDPLKPFGRFGSREEMLEDIQRFLRIAMEEPPEKDTKNTASED